MEKIFDLMLTDTLRENFVKKLKSRYNSDSEEFVKLINYIKSDKYLEDVNRLKRGDYFFPLPELKKIKKNQSKKYRLIYIFPTEVKNLLKAISFSLNSLDSMYSDSLYSFRTKRSHTYFFDKASQIDPKRDHYIVRTDVHGYAEHIDQDILLDVLKNIFKEDEEFYNFLHWFLKRNQYINNGEVVSERFSLTCGMPVSSFFYNVYLMHLDKYFKDHYDLYMRYSDDIAIYCNTLEEAQEAKAKLVEELNKVKLELNEEKTRIYSPGEPFEILGFRLTPECVDVASFSVKKLLRKINNIELYFLRLQRKEHLSQDEIFNIAYRYYKHLFFGKEKMMNAKSWTVWTFATITTDKTLKIIDARFQRFFRVMLTSKRGDCCYRITYEELKKRGYYSLVNLFHHRDTLKRVKKQILSNN